MRPKILIVDDMMDYLNSLSRALSENFELTTARSYDECKQRMTDDIDLLLVDICLDESRAGEDKGGLEVLRWSKQLFPDKPVVMMTAYRDFDAAVESLNLGADKFLKKPINLAELKETIQELIKRKQN